MTADVEQIYQPHGGHNLQHTALAPSQTCWRIGHTTPTSPLATGSMVTWSTSLPTHGCCGLTNSPALPPRCLESRATAAEACLDQLGIKAAAVVASRAASLTLGASRYGAEGFETIETSKVVFGKQWCPDDWKCKLMVCLRGLFCTIPTSFSAYEILTSRNKIDRFGLCNMRYGEENIRWGRSKRLGAHEGAILCVFWRLGRPTLVT